MTTSPAGWFPDPWDAAAVRYWDGNDWTPTTARAQPTAYAPAPLKAPDGIDGNTVWIWLVVLVPVVTSLLPLVVPWESIIGVDALTRSSLSHDPTAALRASLAPYQSPALWILTLAGWVVFAATVVFSYRDHRELLRRGIPSPFHWAWAFLSPVYAIGRSIIVKRRTGRGLAPMWVAIADVVLGYIVAGIVASRIIAHTFAALTPMLHSLPS